MVRLFLSVDMAGSTQFKGRFADGSSWLDTFRTFFTNFPLMLAGQVGFAFLEEGETPVVEVWKVMGDEVIFVATPESPEALVNMLLALIRTMNAYEERYLEDLPLRLKGTAWLAEFGTRNIELEIPELSGGEGVRAIDFIGPDLDLGFRVTKFSRPACLALSFDVADLVIAAGNAGDVSLHLIGSEELKGVMFGRPYPIIWMLEAGTDFNFMPWEVEQCPHMARAATMPPSPVSDVERAIGNMRLYLRKMHGVERPRMVLGGAG
ncbi:hypothetical protein [Rhizorhabdus dicambivorans]|uniref:Guanylate cyclase domain-containing protein n=1 Tax=Rhizorhabdus dicambivorans TaxID=1850238 RepID=A0A2A4FTJ1_9SPHN|nr:hypothetical protein [Rhizorhabdus dicambivorans]ATE66458.1 hypothetical protein CMV14_20295 [Rhizorhabdus dicambivorans]PCE41050.1 hypothetical protein COO09_17025 [Rhizorhabdus dicambivorans]